MLSHPSISSVVGSGGGGGLPLRYFQRLEKLIILMPGRQGLRMSVRRTARPRGLSCAESVPMQSADDTRWASQDPESFLCVLLLVSEFSASETPG